MNSAPNRRTRELPKKVVKERHATAPARFFGVVLVVALAVGIALSLRHYVTSSPRFAVQKLVITGLERRTESEILELSGAKIGANVFAIDLEVLRVRLLQDPWLAEVRVARQLPNTLSIEVKERKAAALVALGETYLASRDGTIIKRLDQGDPTDFPLVTGLGAVELTEDRAGAEATVAKALDIARQFAATDIAAKHPLQEVHIAKDGTWSLVVGHSGIRVVLGQGPFHRKFEQASRVFREVERRRAKVDAILLDNDARPERVIVRMR